MAEGERENGRFEASKEQTDQGWFLFDSAVMANGYTHKQHRHPTPTIDNASPFPLPFSIAATKRFLFGKDEEEKEEEEEEKGDAF